MTLRELAYDYIWPVCLIIGSTIGILVCIILVISLLYGLINLLIPVNIKTSITKKRRERDSELLNAKIRQVEAEIKAREAAKNTNENS